VTDEGIIERSNGTTWESYSGDSGGGNPDTLEEGLSMFDGGTGWGTPHGYATTMADVQQLVLEGLEEPEVDEEAEAIAALESGLSTFDGGTGWGTPHGTATTMGDIQYLVLEDFVGGGGSGDVVGPASATDEAIALFDMTTGKLIKDSTQTIQNVIDAASATTRTVGITIDGGGAEITTGVKGFIQFPIAGTIVAATLLADQTGAIVIDVWKDTLANYPPTNADSITASAPPTIGSGTNSRDTTLTGWTTAVAAGDVFGFNVDSVTDIERVTLILEIAI